MSKTKILNLDMMSLQNIDEDSDLIPLMTSDDEEAISKESLPKSLPILPLKNTVMFPGVVIPITASRDKSIKLIKESNTNSKLIGVVSQKDSTVQNPGLDDIQSTGTVAKILRVLQMPDGNVTVIIQGKKRFSIEKVLFEEPYITAEIIEIKEVKPSLDNKEFIATIDSIKDIALRIIEENPNIPSEASFAIKNIQSDSFLVNFVSSNMNLSVQEKYEILKTSDLQKRALMCLKQMNIELQRLSLKNEVQSKVRSDLDQQQREYFLHQQLKTIQEELGGVSYDEEISEMRIKATNKKWSKEINNHFKKELSKLQRMNPQVAEYSIQRNYLDIYLELPWNEYSKDNFDLKRAQKILDRDHYGLKDVKRRIIEHIAVLKLRNDMKSPILCLNGPPGVGKTSLGKSIAEALGREYVRISLGGLRDESEIRGHRKTYIGAMPGRIIQSFKRLRLQILFLS
jgi:ATP-dependent Lon protease